MKEQLLNITVQNFRGCQAPLAPVLTQALAVQLYQRENRRRASLEKFITLHKARAVYLGGRGRNKNFTQI